MVRNRLMLGAAFAALGLIPLTTTTPASAQLLDNYDLDVYSDWDNDVEVELEWAVEVEKSLEIFGFITIDGSVQADALAHATLDEKQTLDRNEVMFEDYQNANMNSTSDIFSEPGLGQTVGNPLYTEEGAASGPAVYTNTVTVGIDTLSGASGNIGLNIAAGDYNMQKNEAVLASASGDIPARNSTETDNSASGSANSVTTTTSTTVGTITSTYVTTVASNSTSTSTEIETFTSTAYTSGAAEAGNFSLQSLYDNGFNSDSTSFEDENTDIDNTITVGSGVLDGADGNIGVNIAAGAFNIQANALVIASVTTGNLAEATSALLQHSQWNDSVHEDVTNNVNVGTALVGATGNIGVNLAAGVGNLQHNSLTIASAIAVAGGGPEPITEGPTVTE